MTVQDILLEPLVAAGEARATVLAQLRTILDRVHLPADSVARYPREFSGGQRQRIAIARALVRRPRLVVCDEVVSALDLSTQASVLELLVEIQETTGVSYLFTSHDLGVVRAVSHTVAVMYRGEIVEFGDCAAVTGSPTQPYTQRLLMAAPVADPVRQRERRAAFRAHLEHAAPNEG
jgi:ABC-type glutathione transport system ATPase component